MPRVCLTDLQLWRVPAAFIYQANQAPQYKQAHTIVMGMLAGAWGPHRCQVRLPALHQHPEGCRKYDKQGCGDDRDPDFKYII